MAPPLQIDTARIDVALRDAVDADVAPGVIGLVADLHGVLYKRAFGEIRAGGNGPLETDAVYRIASMSKLATTVAALQLVDGGSLQLDAAVGDYLTEFDDLPVLTGFDADGQPELRLARARATIRQLCSHTSGLGYDTWNAELKRYLDTTGLPAISEGLRDAFRAPLVADPGTEFNYGTSTDWLGLVVEELTGKPLEQVLDESVFRPLGMRDTGMIPSDDQRRRTVPLHVRGEGGWTAIDFEFPAEPEFRAGGHGLYSTPEDYARLQRALLAGGQLDGVHILSTAMVAEIFRAQTGELRIGGIPTANPQVSADVHIAQGQRWGLAFPVTESQQAGMRAVGSGGWAGLWNTFYWLDPQSGITAGLYTQTLPFCDPEVIHLYEAFERAVYAGNSLRHQ